MAWYSAVDREPVPPLSSNIPESPVRSVPAALLSGLACKRPLIWVQLCVCARVYACI